MKSNSSSLYLERFAAGHKKGCDMAIPELRSNITTKCTCVQIEIRHNKNLDRAEEEYLIVRHELNEANKTIQSLEDQIDDLKCELRFKEAEFEDCERGSSQND